LHWRRKLPPENGAQTAPGRSTNSVQQRLPGLVHDGRQSCIVEKQQPKILRKTEKSIYFSEK